MAGFPKSARLLRRSEFGRAMDHGVKTVCDQVVLFAHARTEETPLGSRMGLVVSKKVGNAVTRNRVKRHLREAWRAASHEIEPLFAGRDVVVLARPPTATSSSAETADALRKCLDRLVKQMAKGPRR